MTDCPTAVQAELDGQDTPPNKLDAAPAGFGVDWTVQAPLSRRSASTTPRPRAFTVEPTPVQLEVVWHETALNKPLPARGFGLGVMDHPVPDEVAVIARAACWLAGTIAFAPAGAAKAATASTAVMPARLARDTTSWRPAGAQRLMTSLAKRFFIAVSLRG